MKVTASPLPGVLVVEPRVFGDARGAFFESYHRARYTEHGIAAAFVQDNVSRSARGTLRGLHLQHPHAQAKLVGVAAGRVFDVAVDLRVGSPHFGHWFGLELDAVECRQLYIPAGFAHGFCALSDEAVFSYKCDDFYAPDCELTVRWDDPAIAIEWPIASPVLSPKDAAGLLLRDLDDTRLPRYAGAQP